MSLLRAEDSVIIADMKKSVFQTAPARALIVILAVGSLGSYVAMVSCSRTVVPPAPSSSTAAPTQQAAPPAAPAAPQIEKAKDEAPANVAPKPPRRIYGPASKSDLILAPPESGNGSVIENRIYGPATKAAIIVPRPAPAPQPAQPAQKAPAQNSP